MEQDLGLRVRIIDDRGRAITVTGRANSEWLILKASLLDGAIYNELTRSTLNLLGWLFVWAFFTSLVAIALFVVAGGFNHLSWKLPVLVLLAALIFRVTAINSARRRVLQRRVRKLVAAGMCPSCHYIIAAIPADPAGFIICPECGGSWKPGAEPTPSAP